MENPSLNPPNSSSSDEEWKVFLLFAHFTFFTSSSIFLHFSLLRRKFHSTPFFAMLECYTQQSTSVNVRSEE